MHKVKKNFDKCQIKFLGHSQTKRICKCESINQKYC